MNTMHFKYAVEVERTGSISQAAANLYMAQPNLSKAIKELEESIGISIFVRSSKGMIPTEQGLEFLKYAKKILIQLDNIKTIHILKEEREQRQYLKISIPRVSYISYGITKFINELDLKRNIDVHIQETNLMNTIANVLDSSSDFGIIRYQVMYENYFLDYLKERDLAYRELWEFECLVLMSQEHALAKQEMIDYHQLSDSSIEIIHEDNVIPYCPNNRMKQVTIESSKGISHKQIYVCDRGSQFDLLTNVPTTYMRVSPIPMELCNQNRLIQRKCEIPNNKFKDIIVYHKGYQFKEIDYKCIKEIEKARDSVAIVQYK